MATKEEEQLNEWGVALCPVVRKGWLGSIDLALPPSPQLKLDEAVQHTKALSYPAHRERASRAALSVLGRSHRAGPKQIPALQQESCNSTLGAGQDRGRGLERHMDIWSPVLGRGQLSDGLLSPSILPRKSAFVRAVKDEVNSTAGIKCVGGTTACSSSLMENSSKDA